MEFKTYPQLALISISRKREKDFWGCITHDEIIRDYNTKAVNVDAYQRRDNNNDTAGKGYQQNPTTDEQVISKTLFCSILSVVEKGSLVICNEQFSYLQRTSQVEASPVLLDTFSKSLTLLAKSTTYCFLEFFFLKLLSCYNRLSKKVLCPIFICCGTSRDFIARLAASRPKNIAETRFRGSFNRFVRTFVHF